jgi:hypothetical protein
VEKPTCERCGSDDLRRAHARSLFRRLYRSVTGLQRYACNACRHRGWTDGELPARTPRPKTRREPLPGRPVEHRDHVAKRQATTAQTVAVTLAVALGAVIAAAIGWSCG